MVGVWDGMKLGWIPTDGPSSQSYPNIPMIRRCSTILPTIIISQNLKVHFSVFCDPPSICVVALVSPHQYSIDLAFFASFSFLVFFFILVPFLSLFLPFVLKWVECQLTSIPRVRQFVPKLKILGYSLLTCGELL